MLPQTRQVPENKQFASYSREHNPPRGKGRTSPEETRQESLKSRTITPRRQCKSTRTTKTIATGGGARDRLNKVFKKKNPNLSVYLR